MIKRISIEITDVNVLKNFLKILDEYNLRWILDDVEVVSSGGQIKLSDSAEIKKKLGEILAMLFGKKCFNELLLGIDVNTLDEIILVVVADGDLILNLKLNFEKILDKIDNLINLFNYRKLKIGIGNGNVFSNMIYNLLRGRYGDRIRLVDERSTSKFNPYIRVRDEDIRAAIKIALSATL